MLARSAVCTLVTWILGTTGAFAFTFSDESSATCTTAAGAVVEIAAPPGHAIYQSRFTGMTLPVAPGSYAIYWNTQKLAGLP